MIKIDEVALEDAKDEVRRLVDRQANTLADITDEFASAIIAKYFARLEADGLAKGADLDDPSENGNWIARSFYVPHNPCIIIKERPIP